VFARFFIGLLLCSHTLVAFAQVDIDIRGVADDMLENVRTYLSLQQQQDQNLSPGRIQRLHRQAPAEIKRALQPFGYYQAQVASELIPPSEEDDTWQARYRIDLGLPVTVTKVDVNVSGKGQQDPTFQALLADFPVKMGNKLSHPAYEQGKQALQELADDRGYFDAQFTESTLRIDVATDKAEVILHFQTGKRYRFSALNFEQDFFNDELLERFVTFEPGDFYTSRAVSRLRSGLNESGYFERIKIDTQQNTEDSRVAINVTPVLRKPNRYRARIGYGTDTGPRVRLDWERRYLNRYGHRLTTGLTAKREQDELEANINYIFPLGQNIDNYLVTTLSYESKDITLDDSDVTVIVADEEEQRFNLDKETRSERLSFKVSKHHYRELFGRLPLDEVISLEYFTEDYNLLDILPAEDAAVIEIFIPEVVPVFDADFDLLMPGLNWTYQRSNNRLYTTRGEHVDVGIRGARDGFGSNLSFWQARLSGAVVRKLGDQGRVIVRSDIGYTEADTVPLFNVNILPESLQFKAGGGRSVRGYGFEEIDAGGLGGRHLLVNSLEYEHRIFESWGLAAFYDAGDVFNDFSDVKLNEGAGGGVRWYSPLGPIRLDIASGLSKQGNPIRVHFSVGSEF
jgi:translocation and assembly module TamA